jgi:glycosyltransferase involved in cell wall biosynthesis
MYPKVLIITNIPSPYRVLQFNELAKGLGPKLCVVYFQQTESNRNWKTPNLEHKSVFLNRSRTSGRKFHPGVFRYLVRENPQIVITTGFTATIFLTFIYTKLTKKKFVIFTDSWLYPVSNLNFYHRLIRTFLIPRADASICVGKKGKEFLYTYGAKENSIFLSPLAIDNDHYSRFFKENKNKEFDFVFSGQFIHRKMPFFVLDILRKLKTIRNNINILILGSGHLKQEMIRQLKEINVSYSYPGFIHQESLAQNYANARILLFPTKEDPWGIVANEACAVGTPVITCENAGVADDLVIHDFNGFVLPLDVDVWVEHILRLLSDIALYDTFSRNSLLHIQKYSVENAARGIENAINYLSANESIG